MKFDCLTYSVGHVRNVLISLFISNIQFYYHPGMWGWVYPPDFPRRGVSTHGYKPCRNPAPAADAVVLNYIYRGSCVDLSGYFIFSYKEI